MNMYYDHKNKKRQRDALTSQHAGSHCAKKNNKCNVNARQLSLWEQFFTPGSIKPFEKWHLMAIDFSSLDVSGVPEAYGLLYVIFQSVTVCSHIGQGSGACQLPLT